MVDAHHNAKARERKKPGRRLVEKSQQHGLGGDDQEIEQVMGQVKRPGDKRQRVHDKGDPDDKDQQQAGRDIRQLGNLAADDQLGDSGD